MDDARYCPECGTPHPADTHFCTSCGHAFAVDAPATPPSAPPPPPPGGAAPAAAPAPPAPPPGPLSNAPTPGATPIPGAPMPGAMPPPIPGAPMPGAPLPGAPMPGAMPAGGPPPPPYVAPVPAAGGDGGSKRTLWLVLGAVALVLVVAGGAFALLRGGDDGDGAELFLEPVAFTGDDPFTASVDVHNVVGSTATTAPVIDTTAPGREVSTAPTHSVSGAWPGLYGGTRDVATCDPEQLVAFLDDNPAKARAWAGVLGIPVADIEAYVDDLTPVILQRDTRVTNHGFRNGQARATQSVLQAGTAVMVDEFGVPRVKCNCGNPLTEPQAIASRPSYQGERWPTFSPANVVRVTTDVEVSVFVLVDVKGGPPISRPTGTTGDEDGEITVDDVCDLYPEDPSCTAPDEGTEGEPELGTGDVQVTLRWGSTADLDLSVTDPTGATVDFQTRTSSTGGSLDVDSNADCSTATSSPVENVFWPTGSAPDGEYVVTVTYYNVCGEATGPQSYELTFKVAGTEMELAPASMQRRDDGSTVATYELGVGTGSPSLLGPTGATIQTIDGTVAPGEEQSYRGTKPPGIADTPEPEPEPEAPAPADETPAPGDEPKGLDCSQYEEGTPMRILCEHDPTGEDARSGSAPVPVPGD